MTAKHLPFPMIGSHQGDWWAVTPHPQKRDDPGHNEVCWGEKRMRRIRYTQKGRSNLAPGTSTSSNLGRMGPIPNGINAETRAGSGPALIEQKKHK